jgi:hypothetical protein
MEVGFVQVVRITIFKDEKSAIDVIRLKPRMTSMENQNI